MKSHTTLHLGKTLSITIAGALLLGLAACDQKLQADKPGKTFDSLVENAGRNLESAPAPAPVAPGLSATQPGGSPATDAALAARVKAALSAEPALRSVTVDVKSTDGVVTLYGTADSSAKSHQAAIVAMNVDGVRSVKNEMVVVRGS
jgi:hyperosmotically inducible periplasmic protein